MRSWVIGATGKLLWIWHELYVDGRLRATEEILGVHVDTAAGRSSPFPTDVAAAHRGRPGPGAARGGCVGQAAPGLSRSSSSATIGQAPLDQFEMTV